MRASRPALPRPPPPTFNYPYGVYQTQPQPYHLGEGFFSQTSDYVLQDQMIDDFAINQGQYLVEEVVDSAAAGSSVPALPAPDEAFVPPAPSRLQAGAQKHLVPRSKASVTVDEDPLSVAYREERKRQKELEMQIQKNKELETQLAEQQSKLSAISRSKAASAAGSASQDCVDADDSGFVGSGAGKKRKVTPVKLTIKRKKSDDDFYVEQDENEFDDVLPLAQSSQIDFEDMDDDSPPDIEEVQSSGDFYTVKVRKMALNKPQLSYLKGKLEEETASLTDEQVLAAEPKSLSAPDKRRRTLLLQKARQARYISKSMEERGAE